jgi:hypothetical protein
MYFRTRLVVFPESKSETSTHFVPDLKICTELFGKDGNEAEPQ